ncbi:MAG: leucine-rich repeat protein [Bacteroidaceae bacterium]|nr:leucine-rich repeat protein [Bacteroidaceae bacterium]
MKKVIYLTFLLLLTITANAQENDDSLIFYDKTFGCQYRITGAGTAEVISVDTNTNGITYYFATIKPTATNPNDGQTYNVTGIGKNVFISKEVNRIIIEGNNLEYIGDYAFSHRDRLEEITLPNSLEEIGTGAFQYCTSLKNVNIPNNVRRIGAGAFIGCTGLKAVYIGSISTWNKITFDNNNANPLSYAKDLYLDNRLITDLVIPDGTTRINPYAFCCGRFSSVTIPSSITNIDASAFWGCQIKKVHIESLANWYRIAFQNQHSNPLAFAEYLYANGKQITTLVVPEGITNINPNAFYGYKNLKDVSFPNSVKTIGEYAFYGTGLTEVRLGTGLENIETGAFLGCTELGTVYNSSDLELEKNSTTHGYVAYYARSLVTKFSVILDNFIFRTVNGKHILDGYLMLPSIVTLPKSYKGEEYSISYRLFYNCTGLTSVTIPESVTGIGYSAFGGCTGLTNITIPNSVTEIGNSAFEGCTGLTNITIPNSVTEIGNSVFSKCSGLTSATIGNGVTNISNNAFYNCTTLKSVAMSENVNSIGTSAFSGCSSLENINIANNITTIGNFAFNGCAKLSQITIPENVTSIGAATFQNCTALSDVNISDKVTEIGNQAFYGCTGLKKITIPNCVTSIGDWAFYNCIGLEEFYAEAETPIQISSFFTLYGCYGATRYVTIGSKAAYQAADYWKNFINIVEKDFGVQGDVNHDNAIDVADVTEIVSVILEGSPSSSNFDVDNDGVVDIADVTCIVSIILNQ